MQNRRQGVRSGSLTEHCQPRKRALRAWGAKTAIDPRCVRKGRVHEVSEVGDLEFGM